ncbi:hypothetical protein [uncultured Nostoc sp.]|uniref:hypothetical protein n=1 Tax=uncultured Nostoc sp. TaxID=340711 RepID=UPI0035CC821A
MTTTIVHPSIENLQQFSDSFDIEKLLQSEGILPWLLANGWNYDEQSCLIANIIDDLQAWIKFGNQTSLILRICLMTK